MISAGDWDPRSSMGSGSVIAGVTTIAVEGSFESPRAVRCEDDVEGCAAAEMRVENGEAALSEAVGDRAVLLVRRRRVLRSS